MLLVHASDIHQDSEGCGDGAERKWQSIRLFIWLRCAGDCQKLIAEGFYGGCSVIRDQVVPVLGLLEAPERHLCAGNVFLWVLKVLELEDTLAELCC